MTVVRNFDKRTTNIKLLSFNNDATHFMDKQASYICAKYTYTCFPSSDITKPINQIG